MHLKADKRAHFGVDKSVLLKADRRAHMGKDRRAHLRASRRSHLEQIEIREVSGNKFRLLSLNWLMSL